MEIGYFSLTGNSEHISKKISDSSFDIRKRKVTNQPCIIITGTLGFGQVPSTVNKFIKNNREHVIGLIGTGNSNWGLNFCKAVDILSARYNLPILAKVELRGSENDYKKIKKEIERIVRNEI